MKVLIALLYLAGVVLLVAAGFRPAVRVSLAAFAGACALLAFALPTIQTGFGG